MYICKKHSKSSRIHIVYCLPSSFLIRIQYVYEQKILQISAYTIFHRRKKGQYEKNYWGGAHCHEIPSAPAKKLFCGIEKSKRKFIAQTAASE